MRQTRGFTLAEILVVLAVVTLMLPILGRFFADGWVASRRAVTRAEDNQLILLLMKQWQSSLHDADTDGWHTDGNAFSDGTIRVYQDARHMVVEKAGARKTVPLPVGALCKFAIEKHPGLASCAIMSITWKTRRVNREDSEDIRFVACGRH